MLASSKIASQVWLKVAKVVGITTNLIFSTFIWMEPNPLRRKSNFNCHLAICKCCGPSQLRVQAIGSSQLCCATLMYIYRSAFPSFDFFSSASLSFWRLRDVVLYFSNICSLFKSSGHMAAPQSLETGDSILWIEPNVKVTYNGGNVWWTSFLSNSKSRTEQVFDIQFSSYAAGNGVRFPVRL